MAAKINAGDIISNSFRMLFKSKTIIILALIGAIVSTLITLVIQQYTPVSYIAGTMTAGQLIGFLVLLVILIVISLLVYAFIDGMVIYSVYSQKKEKGILELARITAGRYINLIAASILTSIILLVGFIALIVPGIYLLVRLSLTQAAVMTENKGPVEAIKRSWNMTGGNWWNIFAILVVIGLAVFLLQLIFGIVYTPLGDFVGVFIDYAAIIAAVLIFVQLGGGMRTKPAPKARARSKKR